MPKQTVSAALYAGIVMVQQTGFTACIGGLFWVVIAL
jgi:hypothetical protein